MTSTTTAYRVGWLIDGSGQPAVGNRIVIVKGPHIQQILNGDCPQPPGIDLIDLSDCTMLPALIDSHVHLVMSGTTEPSTRQNQLTSTYAERRGTIAQHLRQHWRCGVMAVRDGGDHYGDSLRFKYDSANQSLSPVTIASPGRARRAAGRYGKLIGIAVEPGQTLTDSTFGKASRRDHLKLVNSGLNSLTQFGVESLPQFETGALKAVIAAAKERHLPTMVHANGYLPVKRAVVAGCDSIEHGFFMGRENMRRMADMGVVWVPTAGTMKAYSDYLKKQGHRSDPSFADVSRRNLDHQLEQIGIARQIGVTLALGTDAGSPGVHHGWSVKVELELFMAAGLCVEEAVRCASRNGARLMRLTDRGKIAAGMRADVIAVKAPPEQVPGELHRIAHGLVAGCAMDLASTASPVPDPAD
ncbi:MAG: amidohydrolase family protein [Desulfosarcina sp.]|jgi:imidazolonepropionase-like amidohydrolase